MLEWDIIEERPSLWGRPCNLVATRYRSPRYCVDYRHTHNGHMNDKSWQLPNIDSCLYPAGGVMSISATDALGAVWQMPVREGHIDRTAFVTSTGKICFKGMPSEVYNDPWFLQHMIYVTFRHLGFESILTYMDDIVCLNPTSHSHLMSFLEQMFSAFQAAGLSLNKTKLHSVRTKSDTLTMSFRKKATPSAPTVSTPF